MQIGEELKIKRNSVDCDGCLAKVSPEGEVLLEVELAGKSCTNLAFGGKDGRTCYVTIADRGNIEYFRTDKPGRSWESQQ